MGHSNPPAFAGGSGTYLVLLQVGFTKLPQSLGVLVSSYLTFSPLPCGIVFSTTLSSFAKKKQVYQHFSQQNSVIVIPQGGIFSVALSLSPSEIQNGDSPHYGPPCPAELGLSSPP
jgi:hypothetical protein